MPRPRWDAVMVPVRGWPTLTVDALAVFVTTTSAGPGGTLPSKVTDARAKLLARLTSTWRAPAATMFVSAAPAGTEGSACATTAICTVSPRAMEPSAQALGDEQVPWLGVAETPVRPAG